MRFKLLLENNSVGEKWNSVPIHGTEMEKWLGKFEVGFVDHVSAVDRGAQTVG